jgi:F0F1-type ATP synthase, epsilon subunit (mitochondrial delta subunit)
MADKFTFDLVSPERRLASVQATAVIIPGADGDMTAMADHVPTITSLRPGILRIEGADGGDQAFLVTGGFADIAGPTATVLAEQAMPVAEVTDEIIEGLITEATKKRDAAGEDSVDAAAKVVADLVAARDGLKAA